MLQRIWAPWRMNYVVGDKPDGCVFCLEAEQNADRENYILYRAEYCFVILNRYPYNSGHVMVVPFEHVSCITALAESARNEMMHLAQICTRVLKSHLGAEGVNIGMNIGRAAGAGIDQHLHLHLVPRWSGDTNFMTVMSDTRVVPQDLEGTYEAVQPALKSALDQEL